MPKKSAGLLLYREVSGRLEVLLVHPGGPFWAQKDDGAWSIPKGEIGDGEDPLTAARREFEEETGFSAEGEVIPLHTLRQPSGKLVHAFAMQKDIDASRVQSNTFDMEWPPRSGKYQAFPEVDRAAWFSLASARSKIVQGQAGFLSQLEAKLGR
ncbi:MAG TPA: NUDIX domain-containing protein, partial [Candidatus Krumholzibacteria bacterium]|nr:NUDIX domain-containing protein [Candidatus Krumholzibacteria bacterium]